ncbi:hypothetical protein ES288_D08G263300v1 [Gossypium darwinii]|uniref:Uncharacterized protein n=1 Tax=Gossypium darwinii TaxID=34276 RepID=A0A5D2BNH1_GOSDA|nr:hypothetical protein ES288_D08G263300v1 [Gossypium darwinii]
MVKLTMIARVTNGLPLAEGLDDGRDLTDAEMYKQQAELESFKMEYANAQLECNEVDERANILASEVIGLEEKACQLRSNELKLERQLENSQAEISSFKNTHYFVSKQSTGCC